jgi:hypothetical protein
LIRQFITIKKVDRIAIQQKITRMIMVGLKNPTEKGVMPIQFFLQDSTTYKKDPILKVYLIVG